MKVSLSCGRLEIHQRSLQLSMWFAIPYRLIEKMQQLLTLMSLFGEAGFMFDISIMSISG